MELSDVRVLSTLTKTKEQRRMVRIHTKQASFEVTEDHRLPVKTPQGKIEVMEAREIRPSAVFDGDDFQSVVKVECFMMESEVVELELENDGVVMAWTPKSKRPKKLDPQQAFAAF